MKAMARATAAHAIWPQLMGPARTAAMLGEYARASTVDVMMGLLSYQYDDAVCGNKNRGAQRYVSACDNERSVWDTTHCVFRSRDVWDIVRSGLVAALYFAGGPAVQVHTASFTIRTAAQRKAS